jgi:hypothetical protein
VTIDEQIAVEVADIESRLERSKARVRRCVERGLDITAIDLAEMRRLLVDRSVLRHLLVKECV